MKKILSILLVLFMICGCSSNSEETASKTTSTSSGNNALYQNWAEIPLLTDASYLDFYFEYQDESMGENHSELYYKDYWTIDDTINHFILESQNEDTFVTRQILYGVEDGIKYDECFHTTDYDINTVKDESYWFDYNDKGEVICCTLNIMEFGDHAPYTLTSVLDLETNEFVCDKNDLKSEYPDDGESTIKEFMSTFVYDNIDAKQFAKELESDAYFYYSDAEYGYSQYVGPNALCVNLMSININENGRYIYGYFDNGNDCKLYIDEQNRVIKIEAGYTITYDYADDCVTAVYKQRNKDEVIYKYDYNRNQIAE